MVLPAIPIEIGRETIAKILPCGDLATSPTDSGSNIRTRFRYGPMTGREIDLCLERPLNREVSMLPLYCCRRPPNYCADVRFLTHAEEVTSTPSSGRVKFLFCGQATLPKGS